MAKPYADVFNIHTEEDETEEEREAFIQRNLENLAYQICIAERAANKTREERITEDDPIYEWAAEQLNGINPPDEDCFSELVEMVIKMATLRIKI